MEAAQPGNRNVTKKSENKRRDLIQSDFLSLMASVSPKLPGKVRIQPVLPYRDPAKGDIGPLEVGIPRTGPSAQPAAMQTSLSHKACRE